MRRLIYVTGLCIALIFSTSQRASAQFATFDASNLAQSILGFLQDGDNMVIRGDIYKAQSVIQMAKNYEQMASMFVKYVDRVRDLNGKQISYAQGRSMVNEGFQYLLYASREVKRAREYLDSKSQVSEEERMAQLAECNRQISKANAAMYNHIRGSYEDIFKINW